MIQSAGILVYTRNPTSVLLAHPGGPFYTRKDLGVWTIPKGIIEESESPIDAALREFKEETNLDIPNKLDLIPLKPLINSSRKFVNMWIVELDLDVSNFRSNLFDLEWPPKSNRIQQFPEMDAIAYFPIEIAKQKISKSYRLFIEQLETIMASEVKT